MALGPTASTHPTMADWAKTLDPDGSIAAIAEIMNETNEILDDMVWLEGNLPTGHRTTVRSDLPAATWRKLNYGVPPTKSRTTQVTDAVGMLEDYAEVDKDLADLNGNSAEFRLSEDRPHIEGINQTLATTIFYGDTDVYPERFMGLAPRYDAVGSPAEPGNGYLNQVIDAGGSASNALSSIWLIVWGANTVHGIFPKGSKIGLQQEDKGQVTLYDSDGGRFEGYRTHYQWKAGLVVRDWRYVVRIANIDSTVEAAGNGYADYTDMIKAINTVPNLGMGRAAFYMNRSLKTIFDIAAAEKTNAALKITEVFGRPVTSFWNIPIRQCDALLNTEAELT